MKSLRFRRYTGPKPHFCAAPHGGRPSGTPQPIGAS